MKFTKLAAAAAIAACTSISSANALPLTLDGGWTDFTFAGEGSAWSDDFTFTITDTAFFAVTDYFCAGDQFSFSVNGTNIGATSVPSSDLSCSGDFFTADEDFAFSSSTWTSGEIELASGTYTVTGTTLLSPFGNGTAVAQLSSVSLGGAIIGAAPVPLPASGLLLVAGVAGIALAKRRRKS